ncbi:hypothetical protein [Belnapia rosea]|uniref:Uncharacterized protein n=1 Tax=Belnapia rosea TaxID=938405 RepID=A0A1G6QVU1_9PROT|nr:hypothetical protein [Belnapia rosea]SDB63146.1 hypothetical protein SAMN02927895_02599 [Belnapia rosea]SDC96412.1 hypothetical protein SAMN04487779_1003204 [Belnapia rosea]
MRNPILPLAALLLGLAAPALAQQAATDDAAARTLAQNARISFSRPVATPPSQVPNAAPDVPVSVPRAAPPSRRLALASNPAR